MVMEPCASPGGRWAVRLATRSDRGRLSYDGLEVKVMTLDTFVETEGIEVVDLIRCDIEGEEGNMVKGGKKTLRLMPKGSWICMDLHPTKCGNLQKALETILKMGFEPKYSSPRDLLKSPLKTIKTGFPRIFFRKK